jgi:hypothetical protein
MRRRSVCRSPRYAALCNNLTLPPPKIGMICTSPKMLANDEITQHRRLLEELKEAQFASWRQELIAFLTPRLCSLEHLQEVEHLCPVDLLKNNASEQNRARPCLSLPLIQGFATRLT